MPKTFQEFWNDPETVQLRRKHLKCHGLKIKDFHSGKDFYQAVYYMQKSQEYKEKAESLKI